MSDRNNRVMLLLVAIILVLSPSMALHAQNITAGAIAGTVTDSTGAIVPNAQIVVTNQATRQVTTAKTSGSGAFNVENLPPGDYSVAISMTGFQQYTLNDLHLDPGQRRGQDIKLVVGSVDTKVTVEADALAVQTESAESGGTITAKEVQNLMVNGRNFSQLTSVLPGVSNTLGANGNYESGQGAITSTVIVNGSSDEETMYTIDGVYNVTASSEITLPITPVIDDIDEMRILSDNYSARFGLAGRQIVVSTKSGGDHFHGSVYGYERSNEYGTAKTYTFQPGQVLPSLHLTDWGLTLGGPVKIPHLFSDTGKNRLYFFVGADWKANHQSSSLNSRNTFTSAIRNGNLSVEPELATGAVLTPYASLDAYHRSVLAARNPGNPAGCIFQETPGGNYNGILPQCMDPNTVLLMNTFWPLPNYTSSVANYINTNPTKFSVNDQDYRGDYNLNNNNIITVRILHEETTSINASRNYNDPSPNPDSLTYNPAGNGLIRWQSTITPNIVNTASYAEVYTKYGSLLSGNYTLPSGYTATAGKAFPTADPLNRIPDISLDNDTHSAENWFWLGVGALPNFSNDASGEVSDDLSWVKHSHVLQFGGTFMWNLLNINASSFPMGNYCINGGYSGDTAADYLLGFLANANNGCSFGFEQTNSQRAGRFHNKWAEFYFQDDWKATPRLTLNLGVRYTYFTAPAKSGNDISNFIPSSFNAAQAPAVSTSGAFTLNNLNQPLTTTGTVANLTTNGLVTACQGTPCGFTNPRKALIAPRLGFAYRLTNDGKTSIHGGYGIGYTQVSLLQTSNLLSNIPFVQQPTYNSTEFTAPTGPAGTIANPPGTQALSATGAGYRPALIQNYSLTVERQITPGGILSIGYAGMTTQHVFSNAFDQNFPLDGTSSGSAACAAKSPTPGSTAYQFDPCINTGAISSLYYRPYAGYSTITTGVSLGVANYNGLLVGYVQKMKDVTAHVSYTFSKALSDINASGVQVPYSSSGTFQNDHNPAGEYGRPDYDRPNVFVYSVVYQPSMFNHASNIFEREGLGGWSISSFMTDESGFAETPTYASGLATRPNTVSIVRNSGTSGKTLIGQKPLYSASDFAAPAYGFFGSAAIGSLRAPKEVAVHVSAEKGFLIKDGFEAKIGAQAFNVFNHPNVLSVSSAWAPGSTSFGTAATYGDPRQMQFYAKVNF